MRINEIVDKFTKPTRRDFMRGIGATAGASSAGINPAVITQGVGLLKTIQELDFIGLDSVGKMKKLLSAAGPQNKKIFQTIKDLFDYDNMLAQLAGDSSSYIPDTDELLTSQETNLLDDILEAKAGVTYDQFRRLSVKKQQSVVAKVFDIEPTAKNFQELFYTLRDNTTRTLHLLGVETKAYKIQEIINELNKKDIDGDVWINPKISNELFPSEEMSDSEASQFWRRFTDQTKEANEVSELKQERDELYNQVYEAFREIEPKNIQFSDNIKTYKNLEEKYEQILNDFDEFDEYSFSFTDRIKKNINMLKKFVPKLDQFEKKLETDATDAENERRKEKEEQDKYDQAVAVSNQVRKDIGLDLMERLKKQRS
jgi:hypothetical protein